MYLDAIDLKASSRYRRACKHVLAATFLDIGGLQDGLLLLVVVAGHVCVRTFKGPLYNIGALIPKTTSVHSDIAFRRG